MVEEKDVSFLVQVRQSAGLLLKNNLKAEYAATAEEFRQYIKVCRCYIFLTYAAFSALSGAERDVRVCYSVGSPSQQRVCGAMRSIGSLHLCSTCYAMTSSISGVTVIASLRMQLSQC